MTPEKARELLDKATPGPWWVETESPCECCTYVAAPAAAVCTPDMEDTPLVAAAPELAQLVADMHYEYAAQVEKNGRKYIITDSDEGHWLCGDDHKVLQDWHSDYMDAENYAYSWNKHDAERTGTTARIIRRLVSEPEVTE